MIDRLLQLYAHAPEHPAKLRLFAFLHRVLKRNRRLVLTVNDGLRFTLDPNDHVERCLIFDDWHEELTTRFLTANLRAGETVLLAGAHIGYHVLHSARAVGPTGRVLACEPQPPSVERTLLHLRMNAPPGQIVVVAHAVGDETCYLPMDEPPSGNSGMATLLTAPTGAPYHAYVDTIENVLRRLGWQNLDVLLLDTEGFERRALAGLGSHRPRLMILESDPRHHERLGESQLAFFDFVRSLGYTLHDTLGRPVLEAGFYPETNLVAVRCDQASPQWTVYRPRR
jgi:FkbM family methyltransferase